MTLRKRLPVALALASVGLAAQPQTAAERYNHFVGARYDAGKIIQTNDFLRDRGMERFKGGQIEIGWQALGTKEWELAHKLPSFGVGVGTAWMDKREDIGLPISLFGFYNGVFWRHGGHSLHYNIEAGLACGWKCYNPRTNPDNIAVGSKVTCRVGLGLEYAYTIAGQWRIGIGGGFTHYSNGAIRKPNKGVNLAKAQLSLAYMLRKRDLPAAIRPATKLKGNEIDITLGYGLKRFEVDTLEHPEVKGEYKLGARYNSMTLQCQYLHRYCHKGKYGVGVSVVYDELTGSDIRPKGDDVEVVLGPAGKRYSWGVFAAHEFCIGQLGIVTQMGYYLHQPKGVPRRQRKDVSFQRAGLKYTLPMGLHAGVNIYAHRLTVADFIEWNIGYSLPINRRGGSAKPDVGKL